MERSGSPPVGSLSDSVAEHVADTLTAGAGLCDPVVVQTLVEEGGQAIADLLELGTDGHTQRRRRLPSRKGPRHRRVAVTRGPGPGRPGMGRPGMGGRGLGTHGWCGNGCGG